MMNEKSASCRVARALPKLTRTVRRCMELDELAFTGRGGLSATRLKKLQDANWQDLRRLEADIMLQRASSDLGVSLQCVLAIADVSSLYAWTNCGPEVAGIYSRLRGAMRSIIMSCDLSPIDSDLVDFYAGPLPEPLPAPPKIKRRKTGGNFAKHAAH